MTSVHHESPENAPRTGTTTQEVTVRRAPNVTAFLAAGAAIGAIAGLLIGALGPGSIAYTRAAIIGFFLMTFLIIGGAVGAIVGLVLDRISVKRARTGAAEVQNVRGGGEHPGA